MKRSDGEHTDICGAWPCEEENDQLNIFTQGEVTSLYYDRNSPSRHTLSFSFHNTLITENMIQYSLSYSYLYSYEFWNY